MNDKIAKPFLKWAGGKTQLISDIDKNLPSALKTGDIEFFVEPFVGSGAVLFYLLSKYKFRKTCIADTNPDLINAYTVIKQNVSDLIEVLTKLDMRYKTSDQKEKEDMFYEIRALFNGDKTKPVLHAAHFIFLNRTCFNGLYRVNSSGAFNVPYGKYKNPKICDEINLRNVSRLLKNVKIINKDFSETLKYIDKQTFVYFDPPYRPLNITSSFNAYSKESFNDESQKRLAHFIDKLNKIGASIMLSNSDPQNTDPSDMFFDDLYQDYNIKRVHAKRLINSNANKRGVITELLITNY